MLLLILAFAKSLVAAQIGSRRTPNKGGLMTTVVRRYAGEADTVKKFPSED